MRRGIRVGIDLDAAAHNARTVRERAGGAELIAVVKADAYGHGSAALARAFLDAGASMLAVAFVPEARELRGAGIKAPILVLFDRSEIHAYFDLSLTPVLHDTVTAAEFSREAVRRGTTLDVHVKADTGMGRMGFSDPDGLIGVADLPGLRIAGLMSHLSEADLADSEFTAHQVRAFRAVRDSLARRGLRPLAHMANSAGVLNCPDAHFDAVRPGLALYGCPPSDGVPSSALGLRPVMSARAGILSLRRLGPGSPISYGRTFVTVRETLVAVLAVGYADGYPRSCSNRGRVLVRGSYAPVLGRVCMDLTVVDVTDVPGVSESDEAVLLGTDGALSIGAWEVARAASTLPYEILTSFGRAGERP